MRTRRLSTLVFLACLTAPTLAGAAPAGFGFDLPELKPPERLPLPASLGALTVDQWGAWEAKAREVTVVGARRGGAERAFGGRLASGVLRFLAEGVAESVREQQVLLGGRPETHDRSVSPLALALNNFVAHNQVPQMGGYVGGGDPSRTTNSLEAGLGFGQYAIQKVLVERVKPAGGRPSLVLSVTIADPRRHYQPVTTPIVLTGKLLAQYNSAILRRSSEGPRSQRPVTAAPVVLGR